MRLRMRCCKSLVEGGQHVLNDGRGGRRGLRGDEARREDEAEQHRRPLGRLGGFGRCRTLRHVIVQQRGEKMHGRAAVVCFLFRLFRSWICVAFAP